MTAPDATADGYSWGLPADDTDLIHRLAHLALHAGGGDMRVSLWAMWRAVLGEAVR